MRVRLLPPPAVSPAMQTGLHPNSEVAEHYRTGAWISEDFYDGPLKPRMGVPSPRAPGVTLYHRASEMHSLERFLGRYSQAEQQEIHRAIGLIRAGFAREAEEILRRFVGPDAGREGFSPLRVFLGESLRLQGQLIAATEYLGQVSVVWCTLSAAISSALAFWGLGYHAQALARIAPFCAENNGHPMPWFIRGLILSLIGDLDGAACALRKAEELATDNEAISRSRVLVCEQMALGVAHAVDCGVNPQNLACCLI